MLSEQKKIVPIASYQAIGDAESINMKDYHKATLLVQLHALSNADLHVLVYSGDVKGDKDSALTFKYKLGGAAEGVAGCDVYTEGSSADLTLAHVTYDDYLLIIEIDAAAMDVANGEEWLTLALVTATGFYTAIAVLEPRHAGVNLTAI